MKLCQWGTAGHNAAHQQRAALARRQNLLVPDSPPEPARAVGLVLRRGGGGGGGLGPYGKIVFGRSVSFQFNGSVRIRSTNTPSNPPLPRVSGAVQTRSVAKREHFGESKVTKVCTIVVEVDVRRGLRKPSQPRRES